MYKENNVKRPPFRPPWPPCYTNKDANSSPDTLPLCVGVGGGAPVCVVVCACVRAREKLCVCVCGLKHRK